MIKLLANLWASPFWQSVVGTLVVNALSALGIGTALATFLRYVIGVAWVRRQLIIGWCALVLMIFLILMAIRFNTVSAKESTIAELQASVELLNERLQARHLSEDQRNRFKAAIASGPDLSSRILIFTYPDCFECRAYAWDFAIAMNDITAWDSHQIGVLAYPGQLSTVWRGLFLVVHDQKHLTPDESSLSGALKTAKLHYSYQSGDVFLNKNGIRTETVGLLVAPKKED